VVEVVCVVVVIGGSEEVDPSVVDVEGAAEVEVKVVSWVVSGMEEVGGSVDVVDDVSGSSDVVSSAGSSVVSSEDSFEFWVEETNTSVEGKVVSGVVSGMKEVDASEDVVDDVSGASDVVSSAGSSVVSSPLEVVVSS